MERTNDYKSITGLGHIQNRLTLSIAETAQALGISRPSVYTLLRQGELPTIKLGRRTLIPVDALRQWIADQAGVKVC